jgi:hypothetical protein
VEAISTARDTWVLGAGPFRKGTILHGTEFAGEQIPVPNLGDKEGRDAEARSPVVVVTNASLWPEPSLPRAGSMALLVPVPGSGLSPVLSVLVQSVLAGQAQPRDSGNGIAAIATNQAGAASKQKSPPAAAVNGGGQAETEPPKVLSSGWGLQPEGQTALPTADDQPMKSKDGSGDRRSAAATVPGSPGHH